MTREVIISINGMQPGQAEDTIQVKAEGTYHKRNGKHFIHYKEVSEDNGDVILNTIKITAQKVEIIKKGSISTQMSFDIKNNAKALYQTPFGKLDFNINTTYMKVKEGEAEIFVELHYSLSSQDSPISDNAITIRINPSSF